MIATRIFRSHFVSPDGRELRAWFLGRICSRSRSIHKLCYLPRCFKCSILGKRSRYRDETKWSFIGVFPTNYNRTFKFYVRSFLTHKKKSRNVWNRWKSLERNVRIAVTISGGLFGRWSGGGSVDTAGSTGNRADPADPVLARVSFARLVAHGHESPRDVGNKSAGNGA